MLEHLLVLCQELSLAIGRVNSDLRLIFEPARTCRDSGTEITRKLNIRLLFAAVKRPRFHPRVEKARSLVAGGLSVEHLIFELGRAVGRGFVVDSKEVNAALDRHLVCKLSVVLADRVLEGPTNDVSLGPLSLVWVINWALTALRALFESDPHFYHQVIPDVEGSSLLNLLDGVLDFSYQLSFLLLGCTSV